MVFHKKIPFYINVWVGSYSQSNIREKNVLYVFFTISVSLLILSNDYCHYTNVLSAAIEQLQRGRQKKLDFLGIIFLKL